MDKPPVVVIGLGEVGLPTALYIKNRGYHVIGLDISSRARERAKQHGITCVKTIQELILKLAKRPICIICISTPKWRPDMFHIQELCHNLCNEERVLGDEIRTVNPIFISIESTVIPGTCRGIRNHFAKVPIVHCPHRLWSGDKTGKYGVACHRVISALDNTDEWYPALWFYRDGLGIPVTYIKPIEVAEISKLVENCWQYTVLAFTEEIDQICKSLDIPYDKVRIAVNTVERFQDFPVMFEHRPERITSHCLEKDIGYLIEAARFAKCDTPLLRGAKKTDAQFAGEKEDEEESGEESKEESRKSPIEKR